MSEAETRYNGVAQAFHWAVAILIAANFIIADIMEELPRGLEKVEMYNLHKSIGLSILALVILRLIWRHMKPPPPLPEQISPLEALASKIGHALLYLVMLALPISGLVIALASAFPTVIFGLFQLPKVMEPSEALADQAAWVHGLLTWVILALIGVHVLAAIKHEIADGHGFFLRMLPGGKQK